ncbi:hypothetical protein [Streptomyces sp. NPDC047123]|uniref:hypothetical protein n=1 Tax=Streptomyces sp. NPDC047123 TaxID=3155622 RepID=UPI0033DA922E
MAETTGQAPARRSGPERTHQHLITTWLAQAHPTPQTALQGWVKPGIVRLPCGWTFNAVRLRNELVHAAVGTSNTDTVNGALAELVDGPVIHNRPGAEYHALVPAPVPTVLWKHRDVAPMLGIGQYLSVPASDLTGPTGPHWAVRPHIAGNLCGLPFVTALVSLGRGALAARRP